MGQYWQVFPEVSGMCSQMYHRVRTDLFPELVWRRIWLGDKSWTNCRSVLGQQLYHDAVREVLRDARANGGTFSGNTRYPCACGPFYCTKCTMLRSGRRRERRGRVLVWAVAPRCDHAAPQNNPPSIAVQTSPMNFWKVAPLDSVVDWLDMRHCSEACRSAHRALVFTDELTPFLEPFFFFASARTRYSVVDKLHQLDDVAPRLRWLRSGRRLWSCSGRDVFR